MNWNPATGWLLVVEDNLDIWAILSAVLPLALPDVPVMHVSNASAALDCLQHGPDQARTCPRLILQNLYLPGRAEGLALTSTIKAADSACRQTPVVVMSSSEDPADLTEVRRLGVGAYLIKPTGINEWVERLKELRSYWED